MALTQGDLQAIAAIMDQKLEPVKTEIDGIKTEIDSIKSVMATKTDLQETEQRMKDYVDERLHQSENMVLSELDRVQEKTNEKFSKLRVM